MSERTILESLREARAVAVPINEGNSLYAREKLLSSAPSRFEGLVAAYADLGGIQTYVGRTVASSVKEIAKVLDRELSEALHEIHNGDTAKVKKIMAGLPKI